MSLRVKVFVGVKPGFTAWVSNGGGQNLGLVPYQCNLFAGNSMESSSIGSRNKQSW